MASSLSKTIGDAMDEELDLDFSGASSGDFAPLEPGNYEFIVDEVQAGPDVKSKKGELKVVFICKLLDPIDGFTTSLWKHCPRSGSGSGILRDFLRGLGFDVDDDHFKFRPSDAVGIKFTADVSYQKNNAEYNEMKNVKVLGRKPATKARSRSKLG